MRRPSRDTLVVVGLLLVLAAVTVLAALNKPANPDASMPPLASFSAKPDGAKALRLWLKELGYAVDDRPQNAFVPPQKAAVALLLEPSLPVSAEESAALERWVEDGGTLIVAGARLPVISLLGRFDFRLAMLNAAPEAPALPQSPLWTSPPLASAQPRARYYLHSQRADVVTHLAVDGRPVVVSFDQGDGRVILSSSAWPFSNEGLRMSGNAALALNTVSAARDDGAVWFDEWHHGLRASNAAVVGPGQWLRRTPEGRSVLLAAGVIFAALVLRGRHFGRAAPLPADTARRAPVEYLTAVAQLSRRAGHRHAVLQQYRFWLKRGLGQRYRLNPTLPDDEYVARLVAYNPAIDGDALRSLLARLQHPPAGEAEMVELAAEADHWLR